VSADSKIDTVVAAGILVGPLFNNTARRLIPIGDITIIYSRRCRAGIAKPDLTLDRWIASDSQTPSDA
jgi:hypothetical protein